MKILLAAILLLTVASLGVVSQPDFSAPRRNCTGLTRKGNLAVNPDRCTSYYSCDAFDQGTLMNCSPGTVFDENLGLCTGSSYCPNWQNIGCGGGAKRKFSSICCNAYFEYDCGTRTFTYNKCPPGQNFQFNNNGCTFSPGDTGCSSTCDSQVTAGPCQGRTLYPNEECRYKTHNNITVNCTPGWKIDSADCLCEEQPESPRVCSKSPNSPCSVEVELNVQNGNMDYDGYDVGKYEPARAVVASDEGIFQLSSNSLIFTPLTFANLSYFPNVDLHPGENTQTKLEVTFSMNSNSNSGSTIFTNDLSSLCEGVLLSLTANRQQGRVSLEVRTERNSAATTLSANVNLNNQVTVMITLDKNATMTASVTTASGNQALTRPNGFSTVSSTTLSSTILSNCPLRIGQFFGSVYEFKYSKCS